MSVPPPGPAAPLNSIGRVGFHSAAETCAAQAARPQMAAATVAILDMFLSYPLSLGLGDLLACRFTVMDLDGPLLLEAGDLVVAKSVFLQDRIGVLAKERGGLADLAGRAGELQWQPERLHRPDGRVLELDHHLARRGLRILKGLDHVLNRAAGHPGGVE